MATRADVARLAGVSGSTVTYALTGKRSISEETKKRVLKAVRELDYHPNFAAGLLAGGKSKSLAMLFPTGEAGISPSALDYFTGAANGARECGYHLLLWPSEETEMQEIQGFVNSGLVAGVLLMEITLNDERVETLFGAGIPITLIGRTADNRNLNYVDRDFVKVANIAVEYLHSLGHRHVAFINTARSRGVANLGNDIRFHEAITTRAQEMNMTAVELLAENKASAGREALLMLCEIYPEVTAVMGLNDLSTFGFMSAAAEFEVKIPEHLSLMSLSSSPSQTTMSWPPLTTINSPSHRMGRDAARILIDQLNNPKHEVQQHLWVGDLEVRGTTAVARSSK